MLLHRKPECPLSAFVETIWHCECAPGPHRVERILPTGDMGIVINLAGDRFHTGGETHPGAIVAGAYSEFFTMNTAQQAFTLGIRFKPGGAFPFFHLPAGELESRHVALGEFWGAGARQLHERLMASRTAEARFDIVEKTLLARLGAREPHPAVGYALARIGRESVAAISGKIGISPRRFADVFRNEVGLTPKRFARVRRFQRALRRMNEGRSVDWAEFALECGYYDQPHFIHDFQAFSGMNPEAYVAREPGYINHVALAG